MPPLVLAPSRNFSAFLVCGAGFVPPAIEFLLHDASYELHILTLQPLVGSDAPYLMSEALVTDPIRFGAGVFWANRPTRF